MRLVRRLDALASRPRPRRLRIESLEDRSVPAVVVDGTAGDDSIDTNLLFEEGATEPHAVEIRVNDVVAATIDLDGFWPHPTTSYFLSEDLTINSLGGRDFIQLGLIRPPQFGDYIHVNGGAGDDTLIGSNGHDQIDGGEGADMIYAGIDEDAIYADGADLAISGGGGVDFLSMSGIRGSVTISPTQLTINGRAVSFSQIMAVELHGSEFNDSFNVTGMFRVEMYGNGGNDRMVTDASSWSFQDGGDGNDTMVGGGGNDTMYGGDGHDIVLGGVDDFPDWTSNIVSGGPGNDRIFAGTGSNGMYGGEGNDTLNGGALGDSIYGQDGNDSLTGAGGNDFLFGDDDFSAITFVDVLDGGAGDDALFGDRADTRLTGGAGFDGMTVTRISGTATLTNIAFTINGRRVTYSGIEAATLAGADTNDTLNASRFTGPLTLYGGGGNDSLRAGRQSASLYGEAGADALIGGAGDDTLNADAADTQLLGGAGSNTLYLEGISGTAFLGNTSLWINGRRATVGGLSFATLIGSDGTDTLDASAFSGMTFLSGLGGNDLLKTGAGGGQLDGGEGADRMEGGAGDEYLYADANDTRLLGGGGIDNLYFFGEVGGTTTVTDTTITINGSSIVFGGAESVSLSGSEGDDTVDASAYGGSITVSGGNGHDVLKAAVGSSYLDGGLGNDSLYGGVGNDLLYSGEGDDWVEGGAGDDFFNASLGNDSLFGGDGNDTVDAGLGNDWVEGGIGDDDLRGSWGDDSLTGGDGNDSLDGSLGIDLLLGSASADLFYKDTDPAVYAIERPQYDFDAAEGDSEL